MIKRRHCNNRYSCQTAASVHLYYQLHILTKSRTLSPGIGYAMFMLSMYIGTYYNIILSWAFFYIFSSFTTSLPWASCGNWWNTAACTKFDSTNCTAHHGIMSRHGVSGQWQWRGLSMRVQIVWFCKTMALNGYCSWKREYHLLF